MELSRPGTNTSIVVSIVVAPLLIAAVALLWRPWAPVLDMAMTEMRVRDVGGRFTPRIGLPGRIGDFPDQGSHPGPWSFYLLAPFYRVGGSGAWGLQLGSVMINAIAFGGAIAIGRRIAGWHGCLAVAVAAAITIRGFGLNVLTHPWNPYFPLAIWLLVLVAAWAVLSGDHRFAAVVAAGATVTAQTHVPYLVSSVFVSVLVLVALLRRWRRTTGDERRAVARSTQWAIALTAVLWIPPVVDQLRRDPGNFTRLYRHFTGEPSEPLISVGTAVRVFFRHLDVLGATADLFTKSDAFVSRSGRPYAGGVDLAAISGLLTFTVWCAAALVAHQRRHDTLRALNAVVAVAMVAALVSMTRIFGKVWFYLTLWAWVTTVLVVLSIAWTAWLVARDRVPEPAPGFAASAVVAGATAMSLGAIVVHDVPEAHLSDGLRAVIDPTVAALSASEGDAVGPDGTYLVFWQDAVLIGSQGYGLVNELDRRGFDVGVHRAWRVPVTHHRVLEPGDYDAEVHFVSGAFIDEWRDRPGLVEVATVDVRSGAELAEFAERRERVRTRLVELDRASLDDMVSRNLFGVSLDESLPQDVIDDLSRLLIIGEPISVFIGPPGSSS